MEKQRLHKGVIAAVAALALFGIGSAIYNSGWSQGYVLGLLTGGGNATGLAPYLAYRAGPGMMHGGFFGFFGVIFRIGFLLLMFAFLAKVFMFARWHMHGGEGPWQHGPWRHGHWQHGPWEQPQQPPAQPQPPTQGSPAVSPDQPGVGGPRPVSCKNV